MRRLRPTRHPLAAGIAVALLLGWSGRAGAEALLARDEALALAFPGAEVASHTVFLSEAQLAAMKERTGREPASKLFTYYTAKRDGAVVGYGVIETHVVRTLPEAFLAVLSPAGAIERVLMLAFYEPPEYRPSDRWLEQFRGRTGGDGRGWRVGRDVHGISGATLTSHAVADALRRIVLLFELVIRPSGAG